MARRNLSTAVLVLLLLGSSVFADPFLGIGVNFTGSNRNQSGFIPPDTMGAVGPSHIVEIINGRYAVYNKTGVQQTASSLDQFWINAGVTPSGAFSFDPRILYDASSGRWFAAAVDNPGNANNYLVAVSNSSDPTAGWTGFKIDSDTNNDRWADFPTMGLDADGVYLAANMFGVSGATSAATSVLVLPKGDLISGSVANLTLFEDINPSGTGFSIQPIVDLDGTGLPAGLLSAYNVPAGFLKTSSIGGPINAPSLNTAGGFIVVPSAPFPSDADQPGGAADIDTGDERFSGNAVRVNGEIWAVDTVDNGGRAAIRWYRIDANTNALLESGTISDPVLDLYYPSIAVNAFGQIVIGMSGSSLVDYASSYAVVGEIGGGGTAFGSLILLKAGTSTYQAFDGIGRNRWGDYSATVVDPTDPFTFWTFQEFVLGTNVWGIQITELNTKPIPEPGTLVLLGVAVAGLVIVRRRRRA